MSNRGDWSKTGRFSFAPYISPTNHLISLKNFLYVFPIVMYPPYFFFEFYNKPFPHKRPLKFTQIYGRSLFFGVSEDTGVGGKGRPPFSP
jgi:hypothetical protein